MLARAAIVIIGFSGCANHCQNLCENMASFARSECDLSVPDGQVDDCITAFEDSSSASEKACEENADIENEEGWTCEMMAS